MIYIVIGFLVAAGIEYFLSKRKRAWLGLILPTACFLTTVVVVVSAPRDQRANVFQQIVQMGYTLLYFNIPTFILVMIYLRFHKGE